MYLPDSSDRFSDILDAAAELFAAKGYSATSIRDVADKVGLLSGSLYHHIKSKEGLFLDVHSRALERAGNQLRAATIRYRDAWKRLEVACVTFTQIVLDPKPGVLAITDDLTRMPESIQPILLEQRERFEKIFLEIVDNLTLDPRVDAEIFGLSLISTLRATTTWHRKSHPSPIVVGRQIFKIYRRSAADAATVTDEDAGAGEAASGPRRPGRPRARK